MPKRARHHRKVSKRRKVANPLFGFPGAGPDPFLNLAFAFARAFIPNFDQFVNRMREEMKSSRGPESKWRQVLGFTHCDVTEDQVEARYKALAKKKHPDAGGSHQEFVELVAARDAALRELRGECGIYTSYEPT